MNKRRKFLKELGLSALATPLAGTSLRAHNKKELRLRIGLLTPHSNTISKLGECVENGFKAFFQNIDFPKVDIIRQDIGTGHTKEVYTKTARLLADDVDLLVGVVNPMITPHIIPLLQEKKKIFLELSMGERITSLNDVNELVFHHNLHLWQSCFLSGRWAAKKFGKKAIICSSLYDAGYDTVYAFRRGFEKEGGQILGTYIINNLSDMPEMVSSLKDAKPDVAFGLFSGNPATSFLQEYIAQGLIENIPLMASRFMISPESLMVFQNNNLGISHIFPWSQRNNTKENTRFIATYEQLFREMPNEHALLGYESAQWIALAFDKIGVDNWQTIDLVKSLKNTLFVSPRGEITVNDNNSTESKFLVQQVAKINNDFGFKTVEQLPDKLAECEECLREELQEIRSGWMNPYLAV